MSGHEIGYQLHKKMNDNQKNFSRIMIMNLSIIILLLAGIRIIHGPFILKQEHNMLTYKIQINGKRIHKFHVYEEYQKTIIPYFLYIKSKDEIEYNLKSDSIDSTSEKYIMKFALYQCREKKEQNLCEEKDTKNMDYNQENYTLLISKQDSEKELYHGKLIEDITKYIEGSGYYTIKIEGKNNHFKNQIRFMLEII